MDITTILTTVCIASTSTAFFTGILLLRSWKENRVLREELQGTYMIRNVDLVVNSKPVKVTYCVPYKKRNEHKKEQENKIRGHLEINDFGKPNFNEKMVRDHLRNHDLRNVRFITG